MAKSKYFEIGGIIQSEGKKISEKKFFKKLEKFFSKNNFIFGGGFLAVDKKGRPKILKKLK